VGKEKERGIPCCIGKMIVKNAQSQFTLADEDGC
jgi:hypothetical protein